MKEETAPARAFHSRRAFLFGALLAGVQVAALAFSVWAATQPWFFNHISDPFLSVDGYGQRAHGMACEIVISGDSAAMSNFIPAIIQAKTGLKTCNIADLRSIGEFVGTHYPIDDYLAHNPAPRYLITGWAPGNFNLEHPDLGMPSPENWLYALRYRRGPWLMSAIAKNLKSALAFGTWAETALLEDALGRLKRPHAHQQMVDERAKRDQALGMWAVPDPIETHCIGHPKIFKDSTREQNEASVAAFKRHYQTAQTQVFVYVMPVADCVPELADYHHWTDGIADNMLRTQPIHDFNNQDIHLAPPAAAVFSAQIGDEIAARMRQQGTASQGAPAQP